MTKSFLYKPWHIPSPLPLEGTEHIRSYQLKEASVIDASATPPTIGTSEPITQGVGLC